MSAYYNEHDPYAAQWLRNLIAAGLIAPGIVDERDIRDVRGDELRDFTQCHFFAGIGGWSHALRLAGWPDDRPVWTGSCPCPPFSSAGPGQQCPVCGSKSNLCHPRKTGHFVCLDCGCDRHADDRHLWPEFARVIRERGPATVFGEQVASRDGRLWLGAVRADLETMGYASGGADLCAAGLGAPHIRQRLWFVAERLALADDAEWGAEYLDRENGRDGADAGRTETHGESGTRGEIFGLGDSGGAGFPARERGSIPGKGGGIGGRAIVQPGGSSQAGGAGVQSGFVADGCGGAGGMDNPAGSRHVGPVEGAEGASRHETRMRLSGDGCRDGGVDDSVCGRYHDEDQTLCSRCPRSLIPSSYERSSPVDGFWRAADWIFCRDGSWRPVGPGAFPLADGVPARVGRLRAYGNAIVPDVAAAFIRAYLDQAALTDGVRAGGEARRGG